MPASVRHLPLYLGAAVREPRRDGGNNSCRRLRNVSLVVLAGVLPRSESAERREEGRGSSHVRVAGAWGRALR